HLKLVRLFVCSAAVLLLATAAAKIWSAFGADGILDGPDPIFGIDIRAVLLSTAALEGVVAWICLRNSRFPAKIASIAWISTVFLLYRTGLWAVGSSDVCGC